MKRTATKKIKNQNAFTLIEMVLVVSLIGVLAGIGASVISNSRQKEIAEDGVKRANLKAVAEGVETFRTAEGRYPADQTEASDNTYVKNWPTEPTDNYVYMVSGSDFWIYVPSSVTPTAYWKYSSSWHKIQQCTNITTASGCL